MTLRIGINGFGRIGRGVLRAIVERDITDVAVIAINDLAPVEHIAHLLRFDSIHGRFHADIRVEDGALVVNGRTIRVTAEREPADLDWGDIDVAFECTGLFTTRDSAARHLDNGAKRVLISAPGKGVDRTVVHGVNDGDLTAEDLSSPTRRARPTASPRWRR